MFAHELEAWGSGRDVTRWFDVLDRVAAAERAVDPGSTRLLAAVAAGLYKLTAYKDEYEVARLMLDADGIEEAELLASGGSIAWKLHPPMLRSLGLDRKISIGMWAAPAMRVLSRGKRLRGTVLDPFRWAEVRRVERKLPREYLAAVNRSISNLEADNLDPAVELAALPELVRGYEHIKLANVELFRARLAELSSGFAKQRRTRR
jgi:indolepyruvate ferredoxin oxidoreductase